MPVEDDSALARAARQLFQQAYVLQQRGALTEAIRLYRESLAHYPTAPAHVFLGWAYASMRRYEEAIEECRQAVRLEPDLGHPYNDVGNYLIELERWDEAVHWLEQALQAPRYERRENAHFNLGRAHEHFRRDLRALECYRAALALNPGYAAAQQALRLVLGKLN
jgi:tetratricopeptide (TPR) repeat protein